MTLHINLALQGGGAHGAFTWGVLDRLLDEDDVEISAISGTSAGALNGAAFKAGMVSGGREMARKTLNWLWEQIGAQGDMRLTHWMTAFSPAPALVSQAMEYSLPFSIMETASRITSPYALGPFYRNPLDKIARCLQYDKVCAHAGPALFISATNVRTGRIRVFEFEEITPEVLMASACLPSLFQAVEFVDPKTGKEEAFWDGGYMGNPALFPLFPKAFPDDIVIVNINPMHRESIPKTPQDILNRINEISFNSSLLRELRSIQLAREHENPEGTCDNEVTNSHIHMIADDDLMTSLSVATKMVPNPVVLNGLKTSGQAAADRFLRDHKASIGKKSSISLDGMFD